MAAARNEIPHDPFTPNTLYIAIYSRYDNDVEVKDLGMMFCAVTANAGTYFIAQQRKSDGKYILNMTSDYPPGMTIHGWFPIGLRPVEYKETTTANGNVNGVRRDITTEESWLWTARLLKQFGMNRWGKPSSIDWPAVRSLVIPRMYTMSPQCIVEMLDSVPGLREELGWSDEQVQEVKEKAEKQMQMEADHAVVQD